MDTKTQAKEEYHLPDGVAPQNEMECFREVVTIKSNSDDVGIKTETPFSKYFKCESATCNWEVEVKTETEEQTLGSQSEGDVRPVMKNSYQEMDYRIEIKEEPLYLETETSSVCNDIEDEDFPPVKCSRLCMEAVSGTSSDKSQVPSTEVPGRDTSLYNRKNYLECECQKGDITELATSREQVLSEHSKKYSDKAEMCIRPLNLKPESLINEGKKPYQCETCDKSFTQLAHLKTHKLIHEGNKPHQCEICEKRFIRLSDLRKHNLIHEGKKPYQCKTCDKSFTQLSNLKRHYLSHEGNKPHQCKICEKRFIRLSDLKRHYLSHKDKKSHHCKTCDKSFTQLSRLEAHYMIHESKPHQCKTCGKNFTRLSSLKRHYLIHEDNERHKCKICDKSFTYLSHLNMHKLIHEG